MKMASRSFLLLALAFAVVLLVASEMAAAKDLASKRDSEIDGGGYNNGGGGYNNGGGRGGYNNGGGRGGYNNGGGRGGHNGGGGGGGGRGCRYGCCGGRYNHGGCKCCSTFAEATAYKQTQN